jgi:hypothetical protein
MSLYKGCSSGKGLTGVGKRSQHNDDEHDDKWEQSLKEIHGHERKRGKEWHLRDGKRESVCVCVPEKDFNKPMSVFYGVVVVGRG